MRINNRSHPRRTNHQTNQRNNTTNKSPNERIDNRMTMHEGILDPSWQTLHGYTPRVHRPRVIVVRNHHNDPTTTTTCTPNPFSVSLSIVPRHWSPTKKPFHSHHTKSHGPHLPDDGSFGIQATMTVQDMDPEWRNKTPRGNDT